jgi:site-specific DNA-methyltransferase (adenine-specific)
MQLKAERMTITNEDNMVMMARYPDNHFDLAIVDPPYGINADKMQNKAAQTRKRARGRSKAGRGWKEYKSSNWDESIPTMTYFIELFRVSKQQIIWGGNYFPLIWKKSSSFIIWNKMQRQFSLADGELAWYSETKKAMRIYDCARGSALANNKKNGGRIHPTQKPVKLYEWLLLNYAKEGDKILDTHLGSGSIAIACHNFGFELTACELDEEYYNRAMQRIEDHKAQFTLF